MAKQLNKVFPAYAGMIPDRTLGVEYPNRVPRIRGDDPHVILIDRRLT